MFALPLLAVKSGNKLIPARLELGAAAREREPERGMDSKRDASLGLWGSSSGLLIPAGREGDENCCIGSDEGSPFALAGGASTADSSGAGGPVEALACAGSCGLGASKGLYIYALDKT